MKYTFSLAALIAASASRVLGAADLIHGNYYGNAVDSITYADWNLDGTYQMVTNMNDGVCVREPAVYSGGTAPLNEEVSFHFRGPMHLKQFAFYTPGSSSSKRILRPTTRQRRHGHGHLHRKRGVGDWVTATINGQVVSWINEYTGQSTTAATDTISASSTLSTTVTSSPKSAPPTAPSPSSNLPAPPVNPGASTWSRQSYYNAMTSTADHLVFLNNHGGDVSGGSGVYDQTFGMSLSYASSNGTTASEAPQILSDTLLADNTEVILYTDQVCIDGDSCGYSRPGSVAYHGFNGPSKLFLLEFSMPLTGNRSFNGDMPAIWILNAAIARTQQYGNCSCWPECGEWDVFEILNPGNTMAKTMVHAEVAGGDVDYFERPVDGTVKLAVVFDGVAGEGHIVILGDEVTFDASVANDIVAGFRGDGSLAGKMMTKVFRLGSS